MADETCNRGLLLRNLTLTLAPPPYLRTPARTSPKPNLKPLKRVSFLHKRALSATRPWRV